MLDVPKVRNATVRSTAGFTAANAVLVERIEGEIDRLAESQDHDNVAARLNAALTALAPGPAEKALLAHFLTDIEMACWRKSPRWDDTNRQNDMDHQIKRAGKFKRLLAEHIDPAFSQVGDGIAARALRMAAMGRSSKEAAWTVLAKLTLASGALGAKSEERSVATEATRLRRLGSRGIIPRAREIYVSVFLGAADMTAAFEAIWLERLGADDATVRAARRAAFDRLRPPPRPRKKSS
jgi:hypothetical protein